MKVTRDVVLDLLPLYLSGEASADTRALIVEYLAQDQELAQRVRAQPGELFADGSSVTQLPPDLEVRALRRARRLITLQRWLFGPAIALSALALATDVETDHGHIRGVHLVMSRHPLTMGGIAILAALCWSLYVWVRRRLRGL